MNENDKPARKRKPYVKPEVVRVRLDSEVLLVKGCKTSAGSARKATDHCRGPTSCKASTAGS